jgi:hypothetical protein
MEFYLKFHNLTTEIGELRYLKFHHLTTSIGELTTM